MAPFHLGGPKEFEIQKLGNAISSILGIKKSVVVLEILKTQTEQTTVKGLIGGGKPPVTGFYHLLFVLFY